MSNDLKPMLAAKDASKLKFPLLASPKIDGVRALVRNGQVLSRSLKLIPNQRVQKLFGKPEFEGFDGELVVGKATAPDCMQATTSGVMRIEGEPDVRYFVFDLWNMDGAPYSQRHDSLMAIADGACDGVVLLKHLLIMNEEELNTFERSVLSAGYEGAMVRSPEGLYKFGRSTAKEGGLVKIKRFEDSEAVIIDFVEREHNDNVKTVDNLGHSKRSTHKAGKRLAGDLGALVCHDSTTGQTFQVGTGFSAAQRVDFWARREELRGQLAKFKHFAITGVKDAPRFPVFAGLRDPRDT